MEKKYQVFISSTYTDLLVERSEVMQALLELDCIPVGMELFPAADEDQWSLIKRLIDDCDYYILIIGGRYGSLHPIEGLSYTQMEYEYAIKQNIPTISFIHKNPDKIESGKTDQDPSLKAKLEQFKNSAQLKLCKHWETSTDLGGIVSRSLIKLIKDKPRPGWVKSTFVPDEDTNFTMLELRKQIDNLNKQLEAFHNEENLKTGDLAQGDDSFFIPYKLSVWDYRNIKETKGEIQTTWNDLFSILSPSMVHEIDEDEIRNIINENLINKLHPEHQRKMFGRVEIIINDDVYQTIKIQLRALGLIEQSNRKRSIKDTASYWTLTPKGDSLMIQLRAIKKDSNAVSIISPEKELINSSTL